jgi:hypothetical protein
MSGSPLKHYLLASDFDQTLSFNDSGLVLSELLGISGFEERVAGLARSNLVQQGGELAYLDVNRNLSLLSFSTLTGRYFNATSSHQLARG